MLNQEYYKIQQFLVHQQCLEILASNIDHLSEPRIYVPQIQEQSINEDFSSFLEQFQDVYNRKYKPQILQQRIYFDKESQPIKKKYPNIHSYAWIKKKNDDIKIKHNQFFESQPTERQQPINKQQYTNYGCKEVIQINSQPQKHLTSKFKSPNRENRMKQRDIQLDSIQNKKQITSRDSLPTPQFKNYSQRLLQSQSQSQKQQKQQNIINSIKINSPKQPKKNSQQKEIRSQSVDQNIEAHQLLVGSIKAINELKTKMEQSFSVAQSDSEQENFDAPMIAPKYIHLSIGQFMTKQQ